MPELSPDLALPKRYVCLIFLCLEEKEVNSLSIDIPSIFFVLVFLVLHKSTRLVFTPSVQCCMV